jgi:hypothetical protein
MHILAFLSSLEVERIANQRERNRFPSWLTGRTVASRCRLGLVESVCFRREEENEEKNKSKIRPLSRKRERMKR